LGSDARRLCPLVPVQPQQGFARGVFGWRSPHSNLVSAPRRNEPGRPLQPEKEIRDDEGVIAPACAGPGRMRFPRGARGCDIPLL